MKNKNIQQKIIGEYEVIAEIPSDSLWDKIESRINTSEHTADNKKARKILMKPILITAICVMLITTAAATTPLILKMLGSNIEFFDSDKQTRYSADQELIKQYSSKVGITAEGDGFSFTVDNIAYDGIFMSVFYTIRKDINIREETIEQVKRWKNSWKTNDKFIEREAIWNNEIYMEIPGYIERPNYTEENIQELLIGTNPYELLHDTLKTPIRDGYFVSDYELKGMQRYTITDDLPDIFDIEISYTNGRYFTDYLARPKIRLTIDISESKVEKLIATPDILAVTTQRYINYTEELQHDITINKVSISPLGNVIAFTQKGGSGELNQELFNNYFIVDDKGNFYGKADHSYNYRKDWEKDASIIVEFYGNVPSDVQYLKLIPYNFSPVGEIIRFIGENPEDYPDPDPRGYYLESKAYISDLPYSFKQSDYGRVIIESCVVTEHDITVTYRYDGMVVAPFIIITDGDKSISPSGQLSTSAAPVYNRNTDSYSNIWTIEKPIENVRELVKGLIVIQYDVELLEEQAIFIPLK